MPEPVLPGVYRHYKGGLYRVLHLGTDEENDVPVVIYQAQNAEGRIWVRPVARFIELVDVGGVVSPRFKRIGD